MGRAFAGRGFLPEYKITACPPEAHLPHPASATAEIDQCMQWINAHLAFVITCHMPVSVVGIVGLCYSILLSDFIPFQLVHHTMTDSITIPGHDWTPLVPRL